MRKSITANFATIDRYNEIELFDEEPKGNRWLTTLSDVEIVIHEDAILEVSGQEMHHKMIMETLFLEDIKDENLMPRDEDIELGYKTISDFFKKRPKPCVKRYWYRTKYNTPYNLKTSKWTIISNNI